jgi:hypothetical protein
MAIILLLALVRKIGQINGRLDLFGAIAQVGRKWRFDIDWTD